MSDTEELKPCPHCKHGSVPGDPEGAPVEDCLRCDGTGMLASLPVRLRKSVRGDRPLFYEAAAEIERLTAELAAARPPPGVETEGRAPSLAEARKRAEDSLETFEDACHVNEAEWSGWGDMIIPPAATELRKRVQAARALLSTSSRGETDGTSLPAFDGIPSEWQPIETAPVDGAEFLAYADHCDEYVVAWRSGETWAVCGEHDDPLAVHDTLTHWMPLPSAPVDSAPPANPTGSKNTSPSNPLPQDAGRELVEAKTSPLLYEVINRHRPAPNKGEG